MLTLLLTQPCMQAVKIKGLFFFALPSRRRLLPRDTCFAQAWKAPLVGPCLRPKALEKASSRQNLPSCYLGAFFLLLRLLLRVSLACTGKEKRLQGCFSSLLCLLPALRRLLPGNAFKAALAGFFCNGNNKHLGAFKKAKQRW